MLDLYAPLTFINSLVQIFGGHLDILSGRRLWVLEQKFLTTPHILMWKNHLHRNFNRLSRKQPSGIDREVTVGLKYGQHYLTTVPV